MSTKKPIIEVRSISKSYTLSGSNEYYFALRDTLAALLQRPFDALRDRVKARRTFVALDNVSFSVLPGEILGVIGRNGAGKSTLLKILNRITDPTSGEAVIRGRMSSLLEVGTGFHPELSGRENVYFSGAILGMKRKEIAEKFDEIVAFAEVEQFLDTPVKRYSSGMQVRLAFSVAVHMEPDILLIDEVLAVGDAAFQKKCLEKIHGAAKKDGRTIIFVSHNLDVVQNLCDRCVFLEKGRVQMVGPTADVVRAYMGKMATISSSARVDFPKDATKGFELRSVTVRDGEGVPGTSFEAGKPFFVEAEYVVHNKNATFWLTVSCTNENGTLIFHARDTDRNASLMTSRKVGVYTSTFKFPNDQMLSLNAGEYSLLVRIEQEPSREAAVSIRIADDAHRFSHHGGVMLLGGPWENTEDQS